MLAEIEYCRVTGVHDSMAERIRRRDRLHVPAKKRGVIGYRLNETYGMFDPLVKCWLERFGDLYPPLLLLLLQFAEFLLRLILHELFFSIWRIRAS
jgi:hypothetical protein